MTNDQFLFLVELLTHREETQLIKSLVENPNDESLRGVYSDYLKDNGRDVSAELVEKRKFTPGGNYGIKSQFPQSYIDSGFPIFGLSGQPRIGFGSSYSFASGQLSAGMLSS